jgi:hypothetical protein
MAAKETPTAPMELVAFQAAQVAEWGVYTAKYAISIDGVRAFNAGDPVPVSHVTRGVVSLDDVTKGQVNDAGRPVTVVRPKGADAQPDPADVEAAGKANREAGL